jgi:hypothetical protein
VPFGERTEELVGVDPRAGAGAEGRVVAAAAGEQKGSECECDGGANEVGAGGGATDRAGAENGRGQDELREGRRRVLTGAWRG